MSGDIAIGKGQKLALNRPGCDNMPEILRDTIEKDAAILADPNASPEEKRKAHWDMKISRRLMAKGVEELPDQEEEIAAGP